MRPVGSAAILVVGLMVAGCAVAPPNGPYVVAMPGNDKTFEAFQADDASCRQFASAQIGYGSPAQAATQSAVGSAALGAAAGAAIGAAAGNPALGAAVGAGSGLVVGGAAGAGAAQASGNELQWRYDVGYAQCMSAKGETVQTPYPAYAYYPPYYSYYPAYYGPAFVGFGFGGHRFHHFHH